MASHPPPRLAGARVLVTLAGDTPGDAAALLAFHLRNREHLQPWSPPSPADFFTLGYWQRWVAASRPLYDREQAIRLVMRLRDEPNGAVIGQINLSTIVRGALQAATLGYHVDADHQGRGLMHEALALVIDFAHGSLSLHRLMANYIPTNERSARLLQKLGFEVEGYAKDYLFIDGAWRDHVMTALTNREAPIPLAEPVRTTPANAAAADRPALGLQRRRKPRA